MTNLPAVFRFFLAAVSRTAIGGFVSGNGLFTFSGSILPLIVVAVSGLAMALCLYLSEKKKKVWIDSFSIAGSMLLGMAAAVLANLYL